MLHPDRNGRFTASSHAIALGHGYKSPQAFWRQYNGIEEVTISEAMLKGQDHEDDAISAYEQIVGDITTDHQEWIAWENWSGCTLDARTQFGLLECKVPVSMYEEPPLKHWIQVQSQLVMTDEGVADLCAWSPEETRIWRTRLDSNYWPTVEPILKRYWECLTKGMEPKRGEFKKISLSPAWERIA